MAAFKLLKITLACSDISKMTTFYKNVFDVSFVKHEMPGFTMFSTKIGDINFLFCPNQIAGVTIIDPDGNTMNFIELN